VLVVVVVVVVVVVFFIDSVRKLLDIPGYDVTVIPLFISVPWVRWTHIHHIERNSHSVMSPSRASFTNVYSMKMMVQLFDERLQITIPIL
jgi:hypothetical protein